MDSALYEKRLKELHIDHDSICKRCAKCCGVNNDPCACLVPEGKGKYSCKAYEQRLGIQKTVSGNIFTCVSIKDNIRCGFSEPDCAYVARLR